MRSCDDIDEQALSYAEIKALCAGDPRIREKMDLDVQVAKLKVLRGDFQNQKYRLEDKLLKTFPEEIQKQKTRIAALQQDSQIAATHPQDKENFCGMTIKGMVYDDKKAAGERLLLARQEMPNADMMLLGTYRGFELNIRFDSFKNEHQAVLRAELSYPVSLGDYARGNITRLDNAIDNFADRIADAENALQNLEQQKQAAEVEVAKPFAQEEELAEKSARLAELNALLNIDRDRSSSQDAPEETEETETPATRPSVLAALGGKRPISRSLSSRSKAIWIRRADNLKKREHRLFIRVTDEERSCILDKMYGMGIHSLSAYIRKMALDGYCLNLDLPQLRRMAYLLQNCSNNLNQVAKRVNESGKIYAADLADLRTRLDELIDIGRQILSRLAEL